MLRRQQQPLAAAAAPTTLPALLCLELRPVLAAAPLSVQLPPLLGLLLPLQQRLQLPQHLAHQLQPRLDVRKRQLSLHNFLAAAGGVRLAALGLQRQGQVVPLLAHGGGVLWGGGGRGAQL